MTSESKDANTLFHLSGLTPQDKQRLLAELREIDGRLKGISATLRLICKARGIDVKEGHRANR